MCLRNLKNRHDVLLFSIELLEMIPQFFLINGKICKKKLYYPLIISRDSSYIEIAIALSKGELKRSIMPHAVYPSKEGNHFSRNEAFLRKIDKIVQSNLANERFGVEDLAEAMAISRIQLYRTLHKLSGKNISQYIREFRLETAMELLKGNVASVAEIAYRVGFSSPAYFNKCFHDHYGYTPGEVMKLSQQGEKKLLDSMDQNKKGAVRRNISQLSGSRYRGWIVSLVTGMVIMLAVSVFLFKNPRQGLFMTSYREKSIAVLPFRNESSDPENEYFCNGMTDEIIAILQKIRDLRVKSRSSTESYRNTDQKITQIARELDVEYLLEGSIRKLQDDLRIYVHLIDGRTGDELWAETYDRKFTEEIFEFQRHIAIQVADALDAMVTPEENRKLSTHPTVDVTAYDYILRAREEKWKFWFLHDSVALINAERLIDKALKLDPDYARGWGEKGAIYYDLHVQSEDYYKEDYMDSVLWYCVKASRLDPETPVSFQLKAMIYHRKGDFKSAIHHYEKVIKDTTDNFDGREALWRLGYLYLYNKDYQKGISLIRKAVQVAKGSTRDYGYLLHRLAYSYLWMGDFEEAENYYLQSRDMGAWFLPYCYLYFYQGDFQTALDCSMCCRPTPSEDYCLYFVGNTYFQLGDFENAVKYYRRFREVRNARGRIQWDNLYREGIALTELGLKEEGKQLIEEQLSQLEKRKKLDRSDGYDYHLAAIHAYRGDQERAVQYLRDYENKVFFPDHNIIPLYFAQYDRLFEPLWDHPGFKALIKKANDERETGRVQIREMEEEG
jgi:TolB-like protein/AraC-like DNA-binding protein/tetratricopeptide (TPR) repeat protein